MIDARQNRALGWSRCHGSISVKSAPLARRSIPFGKNVTLYARRFIRAPHSICSNLLKLRSAQSTEGDTEARQRIIALLNSRIGARLRSSSESAFLVGQPDWADGWGVPLCDVSLTRYSIGTQTRSLVKATPLARSAAVGTTTALMMAVLR